MKTPSPRGQGGPTDRNATPETVALFHNLMRIQESQTMVFGQYSATFDGAMSNNDILDVTGKLPGMTEWHLPFFNNHYEQKISQVHTDYENGIMTGLFWRMNNPFTDNGTSDTSNGNGGTIDESACRRLLPGGADYCRFTAQLDKFVALMDDFPTVNGRTVPVILRFLPEMGGGGKRWYKRKYIGAENYKALWIAAWKYLVKENEMHNILWCFNPNPTNGTGSHERGYKEFYPGHQYVDVCARNTDRLAYRMDDTSMDSMRHAIEVAAEGGKLVGIAQQNSYRNNGEDAGVEPLDNWWTDVWLDRIQKKDKLLGKIAFACAWKNHDTKNYFIPYRGQMHQDNFVTMCSMPEIMLQPDLPDLFRSGGFGSGLDIDRDNDSEADIESISDQHAVCEVERMPYKTISSSACLDDRAA